jgi:hypothetical protein
VSPWTIITVSSTRFWTVSALGYDNRGPETKPEPDYDRSRSLTEFPSRPPSLAACSKPTTRPRPPRRCRHGVAGQPRGGLGRGVPAAPRRAPLGLPLPHLLRRRSRLPQRAPQPQALLRQVPARRGPAAPRLRVRPARALPRRHDDATSANATPSAFPAWPPSSGGIRRQHSVEYSMMASLPDGGGAGSEEGREAVRVRDPNAAEAFFVPFFSSLSFNVHGRNMTDPDTEADRLLQVLYYNLTILFLWIFFFFSVVHNSGWS